MEAYKIENLSKQYGLKTVFDDISLSISVGDKIALVGINGTGKSALLKCIAEIEDHHGVVTHPKDFTIEYTAQQPVLKESLSIVDNVIDETHPVMQKFKKYDALLKQMETEVNDQLIEQLSIIQQQIEQLDGFSYRAEAESILTKLGIKDLSQPITSLSGGQKKRVALAKSLLKAPDLLLLDEPTNHLDFESIHWLITFIKQYKKSVLVVTHDRYFLNEVTNRIVELRNGKLYLYKGNYNDYITHKAELEIIESKQEQKEKQLYKQELDWMRKGAKARTTKQQARIDRFANIEDKVKQHQTKETMEINLAHKRLGKQVFEFESIGMQFEDKILFKDFSTIVQTSDRIGIVGQNGTGKSTLLNIIANVMKPTYGEMITGQTVKIGYYKQEDVKLNQDLRVIDFLREKAEAATTSTGEKISVTQLLERFLFPSSMHGTYIHRLSGGERKRLYLLSILIEGPNVLLLDEPTNDLDTETLTILENYLENFSGAVITVSHDRYFLNKVVDTYWFVNHQHIDKVLGDFNDYLSFKQIADEQKKQEALVQEKAMPEQAKQSTRVSYKDKRRFEFLSEAIETLETKLEAIDQSIAAEPTNYDKLNQLTNERQALEEEYEAYYEEWDELSERME
ncbi:ABC transporter ATP-binding protein [Macrococcoides goetzii]|nr:ABC-F family ATP-binding cassette domain-containing protein [Macrococcus goetzii]TDM41715.1 ABC transporter ATP-binding protein [Macrococcus goetzii]